MAPDTALTQALWTAVDHFNARIWLSYLLLSSRLLLGSQIIRHALTLQANKHVCFAAKKVIRKSFQETIIYNL
jgi:hypothetical protein